MKELQVFKNNEFGQIRIALIDNKPVLNLYDASFNLGYTKTSKGHEYLRKDLIENICSVLEIKGLSLTDNNIITIIKDTDFETTWITEENFYDLCLESKAKNARGFRKWVTSDVLPTIRKTGQYSILPKSYAEALRELAATVEAKELLEEQNKIMIPKAEYFDELVDRNLLTNFRDTSKELKVRESDFIDWLIENDYVYRDAKKQLKPYADVVPKLFELKEWKRNEKSGTQTLITPRGRETFRLLLIKDGLIKED